MQETERQPILASLSPSEQGEDASSRREHQVLWGSISLLLLVALAVNLPVLHGQLALSRTQYRDFSPVRLVSQSITIQQTSVSQRQRYIPVPFSLLGVLTYTSTPTLQTSLRLDGIVSVESLIHGLIDLPPPLCSSPVFARG